MLRLFQVTHGPNQSVTDTTPRPLPMQVQHCPLYTSQLPPTHTAMFLLWSCPSQNINNFNALLKDHSDASVAQETSSQQAYM